MPLKLSLAMQVSSTGRTQRRPVRFLSGPRGLISPQISLHPPRVLPPKHLGQFFWVIENVQTVSAAP